MSGYRGKGGHVLDRGFWFFGHESQVTWMPCYVLEREHEAMGEGVR